MCFEQVTRRHDGVSVVDAVSCRIAGGSFVALVGASGSGKSTLLRLANGLIRPHDGRIIVDDRDVMAGDTAQRRATGYVFQSVGLFPHMTVGDNIALVGRIAKRPPIDVPAALARVGLSPDMAARRPSQLSGGEQARVGVARALATEGQLLLMDEPFAALDPINRHALGRVVADLHRRLGLTVVLVTHDMVEALLLADRVLVLSKGRIVIDATPRELLSGAAGDEASAMLAVPRAQMARLSALLR